MRKSLRYNGSARNRQWIAERHYEHRDYKNLDKDRQKEYWDWRHNHHDHDHDNH